MSDVDASTAGRTTDQPGVWSGERFVSRSDLLARSARAASALSGLGVGPGDTVALMLRNDIAFLEATLATGALGAYAVPVNWHYRGAEAGFIVSDSAAKVVVVHADLLERLDGVVPAGVEVVVVSTPPELAAAYSLDASQCRPPARARVWESWVGGHEPLERDGRAAPPSMIYTSGTTGSPKGVRRAPYRADQAAVLAGLSRRVLGIEHHMRTVIPAPLYHTAPNTYATAAVVAGGTVVLQPRFDAEDLLALIERHHVSHLQLVPTMFVRLLRLPESRRQAADVSSLRHVVHAAAPCPSEVKREMISWWGPVIVEYYGCTESGIITACTSDEWLAHPGTVGRPVEGAVVRIVDDDGNEVPAGEAGEVFVSSSVFGDFTYQGGDADRGTEDADGFITCGDVGYLDADGYLHLCDRKRDMVISGGANLYPAEVEAALLGLDGVADCAVFGVPDDDLGEVLAAAVEVQPGAHLSAEAVTDHLRGRLASIKVPRMVTFHERLPREDSGKIFKRRLRDPWWEGSGRQI